MYVRRAFVVLAFALAAFAAPALAAQPAAPRGANEWALSVGMEDGDGPAGLQLRGDLEFPMRPLSPVVGFSIVGSLGYSHFSDGYTDWYTGESVDASNNVFRFMAAARFTFGHSSAVKPYADAGLGFYYASWGWKYHDPLTGYTTSADDSEVGLVLRLAGGVTFPISPTFGLGVELGFMPYLGDAANDTTTSLMATATFRM